MSTEWWARFRAIERWLKILALWVFFYRVNIGVPIRRQFGLLNPSDGVCHGPQVHEWRWWQLFSFAAKRTRAGHPYVPSWNIWIWTRSTGEIHETSWGTFCNRGRCFYFAIDMRVREAIAIWL